MIIASLNNSKVKAWNRLKEKKFRDEENSFLIEGDHLVECALNYGVVKEIITTDENYKIPHIPVYYVTSSIMKKLSNQVTGTNIIAVCQKIPERQIQGNVCLLDNIQDPGNLGTIIRSAKAFGIDTLVLSLDTVDLYNDKVIRASEGLLFGLNIIKSDLKTIIKKLKENNYKIYGTNCKEGLELKEVNFAPLSAIIIGNEGRGMKPDLTSLCDEMIHIKIDGESLNAAVAASIIFYEVKNGKRINK